MYNRMKTFVKRIPVVYGIVALLAVILYIWAYGVHILNPMYTDWLLEGRDLTQHYLGWKAYRVGSWTFPIGNTDNLAWPARTSVIFTDSIPLLAVFFKLLSGILPKDFQYFGLWGLLCFILQGIFAARIFGRFTGSRLQIVLGSLLVILSPVMIYRMYYHTALAGQWILLAALERLLCERGGESLKKNCLFWGILGALTVSVHTYFTLMCGIILCGCCFYDILMTKKARKSLVSLGTYISAAGFTAWILGGFSSIWDGWDAFGLGVYSMNLNALFNPQGWSRIYKDLAMCGSAQAEGFAWPGAGNILLLIVAGLLFVSHGKAREMIRMHWRKGAAVIFTCLISVYAAASPSITFGQMQICKLHLPEWLLSIWSVFRATGRIGWIMVYLVILCAGCMACILANKRLAILTLLCCGIIQLWDIHDVMGEKRAIYNQRVKHESLLQDEAFWNMVAGEDSIRNIIFTETPDVDTLYAFTDWATENGKTVNDFCFARSLAETVEANRKAALQEKAESDLFIFIGGEPEDYGQDGLNYTTVDGYVTGWSGQFN